MREPVLFLVKFQANPHPEKSRDPEILQNPVPEIPGLKIPDPAGAWVWAYLIFVTTLKTTGCVKKLARCKILQLECKLTALHTVLLRDKFQRKFTHFQMKNFLASNCDGVKEMTNIMYGSGIP